MPKFSEYVEFNDYVDLDVSVHKFLSQCGDQDFIEIIDYLIQHGSIEPNDVFDPNRSAGEELFERDLKKIHGKWGLLTKEEEETIKRISNRVG